MYNLLVSSSEGDWGGRPFVLPRSRFLEFTLPQYGDRFGQLDDEAIGELTGMPALFAYETSVGSPAQVGRITAIKVKDGEIRIQYEIDPNFPPLGDAMADFAWDLDIDGREFDRSHWAVKTADLLSVVRELMPPDAMAAQARSPEFSRGLLLDACDMLQVLQHGGGLPPEKWSSLK